MITDTWMQAIEKIDGFIALEQIDKALEAVEETREQIENQVNQDPVTQAAAWMLNLRRIRLHLIKRTVPIDDLILDLEDLLADETATTVDVSESTAAHALSVECWTMKRCFSLAQDQADKAIELLGPQARISLAKGWTSLARDDRQGAKQFFDHALQLAPRDPAPHYALADLLYVLGNFDESLQQLDGIPEEDPVWPKAQRLKAACHAAMGDSQSEAAAYEHLVATVPDSDYRWDDKVSLALAHAFAGRRDRALELFYDVWRHVPDTGLGRYARERIRHMERPDAPGSGTTKRLKAFPTTTQKRNYCGPAVLELCLRYLDFDLDQDQIAETVKRETGTPMYEIVTFLEQQGIVSRRIETSRDRIKSAIDLGLPVIVQEEYSTTSHVAVVTGYDDDLGLFLSNDPATHRPTLKSFEWTDRAGSLFGNGAVIVLGRPGPKLAELERACDDKGLVEAKHLTILDEADRLRPKGVAEGREEALLQEVLRRANEALELDPDFELAWYRRLATTKGIYYATGSNDAKARFLSDLHEVRTKFAHKEWAHQFHARWLLDQGREMEASVEFLQASRLDPDDANNLQDAGECLWYAGDLPEGEKLMRRALLLQPDHARACESLTGLYLRQIQETADMGLLTAPQEETDEDTSSPDNAPVALEPVVTEPPTVHKWLSHASDLVVRRARHFNRVALCLTPENPYNHEKAGQLALLADDWERASDCFRKSLEINPDRHWAVWGLAQALEQAGQIEQAIKVLTDATQRFWHIPRAWKDLASLLARMGSPQEAADSLLRGLDVLSYGRESLVAPLYEHLAQTMGSEAAAAKLRETAERLASDADLLRETALLLDEKRQRGHAIALLRYVVQAAPHDVDALYRLGSLLSENSLTRDESRGLLERVIALAPHVPEPRYLLAWTIMEEDPAGVLPLLEPVMDQESPHVLDTAAAAMERLGRDQDAAHTRRLAVQAQGHPEVGKLILADWHKQSMRYDRSLMHLRSVDPDRLPEDARDWFEYLWVEVHRLAGAAAEILPELQERYREQIPDHVAYSLYWATDNLDDDLASRAALALAQTSSSPQVRTRFRIYAAGLRARMGDEDLLKQVVADAGDDAAAWAHISYAYLDVERFEKANAAAKRAFQLDSKSQESLAVMEDTFTREGDIEGALGCARSLMELYPYEHTGPERMAILQGKLFQVDDALENSHRAVTAAPFCHNAHIARAIALLMAGDLEGAGKHAARSIAIRPIIKDDDDNDAWMILLALDGNVAGLKRCLDNVHTYQPASTFAEYEKHLLALAEAQAQSRHEG